MDQIMSIVLPPSPAPGLTYVLLAQLGVAGLFTGLAAWRTRKGRR